MLPDVTIDREHKLHVDSVALLAVKKVQHKELLVVFLFLFFEAIDADSFEDKSEAAVEDIDEADDEKETSEATEPPSQIELVF